MQNGTSLFEVFFEALNPRENPVAMSALRHTIDCVLCILLGPFVAGDTLALRMHPRQVG